MAAKSSLTSTRTRNLCKTKLCRSCGLYINQRPLFDVGKQSKVFWVGLSAVQFDDETLRMPLSPTTNSGALIDRIEAPYRDIVSFYKTNLVKCVPLKNDKIRYPVQDEMEKCYTNFQWEFEAFTPSVVFLLGKQVATFVLKKIGFTDYNLNDDYAYNQFIFNDTLFIPVHHPSFILVYRRKQVEDYIRGIRALFPTKENNSRIRA